MPLVFAIPMVSSAPMLTLFVTPLPSDCRSFLVAMATMTSFSFANK